MTESFTPPVLTFQELKQLAWLQIPRTEGTAALYASEEHARESIEHAASELQRVFTSPDSKCLVSREHVLALELASILESYGGAGVIAARIIVDRYGMKEE